MEDNVCIPSVSIKHNDAPMLTTSVLSHAEEDVKKAGELFRYFNTLDVTGHIEKKNGLSYLSWPFAVQEARRKCPDFSFSIQTFNGYPYQFDPKTGYMVYTTVTMGGITIPMWLPVMDSSNNAMKDVPYQYEVAKYEYNPQTRRKEKTGTEMKTVEAATMFDINKAIMRCLVKNLAMFGLGLHIYAGEDLPETVELYDSVGKTIEPIIEEILVVAKAKKDELNKLGKEIKGIDNWGATVIGDILFTSCKTKNPNNIKSIPVAEATLKALKGFDVHEFAEKAKEEAKENK